MDSGKRTFYLGRYNCIEQLGTGPVGETYRAKIYGVAGFEKQFAVKRLYTQLSEDEAFVARFVQAASAFASLEHQRIARVHEVNAQGAHYYIVVDLVRGLDLRRLLDLLQQRGEALAPDAAMTIAIDVAEALEYAHGKTNVLPGGVLHLGLTAPSVMVTYEGDVKLVDVGLLASLIRPGWSDDDALTATLAYLAPEQWRGESVDARADVFSLGVVLHELLGGARVFLSDRAAELRKAIEAGPPQPPPGDPRLQEIVTRALQPDRDRRFASVAEMRAAIQGILGGRIDRARADLSALVRRLAAPRERRTGAFAAVTLLPAAPGLTSPVSAAKPPPIPAAAHAWSPPTPKPPVGAVLSAVPVHNTLAGIGPDDQALVPIELVELPGLPTEKGMPTVTAEDAETNRVLRAAPDEITPPPLPTPAVIVAADATSEPLAASASSSEDRASTANGTSETSGKGNETGAAANGSARMPEASWSPPALTPPPPSPEPLFAAPTVERPDPVEPARSTVPGVKLPPARRGRTNAVLGGLGLVAAVGALAIYAGLSGTERPTKVSTEGTENQPATVAAPAEDPARALEAPTDPAGPVAHQAVPSPAGATPAGVRPSAPATGSANMPNAPTANPPPQVTAHAPNALAPTPTPRTAAPHSPTASSTPPTTTPHSPNGPTASSTPSTTTPHSPNGPSAGSTPQTTPQGPNALAPKPTPQTTTTHVPNAPNALAANPNPHATAASSAATNPNPHGTAASSPATNPTPHANAAGAGTPTTAPGAIAVPGGFAIVSTPEGATVFVDGEAKGVTPAQVALAPGTHKLIVTGEGQKMVKRDVEIVPNGRVELTLEAAKLPSPIAGSAGLKVRCKSHDEIRIFVDGEDSGRNCPNDERISVAPGTHKIGLFSARTGEMHEVEHEVTEGNNSTRVYVKY